MQYSKCWRKWSKIFILILHGYWTPKFQNFAIPPTWLSYITTSKHCYPCYCFLTPYFQKFTNPPQGFCFGLVIPLLSFHQVCLLFYKKSCDIKEFMAWKLLATVFSVSDETKFDVDNTVNNLIYVNNFKLFISFRKCKERIIQILLISGILNHAGKTSCDKILKISPQWKTFEGSEI